MIVGKDASKFLKNFLSLSNSQAFLIVGADIGFEDLLIRHLICEKSTFCKKCNACVSESTLGVRIYEGEILKIEEARDIAFNSSQSSFFGKKIFVIRSGAIAEDAQATLLKTIEEPNSGTYFIISASSLGAFSRPLISRSTIFDLRKTQDSDMQSFKLSLEDAPSLAQNRDKAEEMFQKIESWINWKINNDKVEPALRMPEFIEEYFEIKKRFFEKTYPPKMLFEHLAISKFYIK